MKILFMAQSLLEGCVESLGFEKVYMHFFDLHAGHRLILRSRCWVKALGFCGAPRNFAYKSIKVLSSRAVGAFGCRA